MTISPIQPLRDYVSKKEFNDKFDGLKAYIDQGFEITNKHIDNLEETMNSKFIEIKKDISGIKQDVTSIKEDILGLTKVVNKIATKIL